MPDSLKNLPQLTLAEAKKKLMDLVAGRDHTEKELREKLLLRCNPEIVETAITWAKEQKWLATPEKLKIQLADQLNRRGKGVRTINQKLENLGLEPIKADKAQELEKATKLIASKWAPNAFVVLDFNEVQKLKAKIIRFLVARGYESDIVSAVLNTFKKSSAPAENFEDEVNNYDEEF